MKTTPVRVLIGLVLLAASPVRAEQEVEAGSATEPAAEQPSPGADTEAETENKEVETESATESEAEQSSSGADTEAEAEAGEEIEAQPVLAPATEQPSPGGATMVEAEAEAEQGEDDDALLRHGTTSELPFRGSKVTLRNTFTAVGLNPNAALTHNPYYGIMLRLMPQWWFDDWVYVRGSLSIATELTRADWTNDRIYIGDLYVIGGLPDFYQIPVVEIDLSAEATLTFPTSQASRGDSLVVGTGVDLSLTRSFDLLNGVVAGLAFGFSKDWHRFTTGSGGARLESSCPLGSDPRCMISDFGSGARNVSWSVSGEVSTSAMFTDWLSAAVAVGVIRGQLYGTDESIDEEGLISSVSMDPTNARYYGYSQLAVSFLPRGLISPRVGMMNLISDQLRPNGSYRAPFFNRFTRIFVDVTLSIDELVEL